MDPKSVRILNELQAVARERARRAADPALSASVGAVKSWQHARFAQTYADLLASSRFGPAARFFLNDLYGPRDFTERDGQFARVVPGLVALFPKELVQTVAALATLHALSEKLDTAMAEQLQGSSIDADGYAAAWRATGSPQDREQQITLTVEVGSSLERYTRKPLLRQTLRLMRTPAQAAGMGALQHFLETGFDTFRAMNGAAEFLSVIETRERALAVRLSEPPPAGDLSPATD